MLRARAAELRSSHDTDATAEETEGNEETVQAERKEVELEFKWADKDANGRLSFDEYLHGKVYTRPFDLVVGWNPPRPRHTRSCRRGHVRERFQVVLTQRGNGIVVAT